MNAAAILLESAEQGIILFYQDGQLGFELRTDVFPPALKQKIVTHRAAIIEYLANIQSGDKPPLVRPRIEPQPRQSELLPLSYAQQRLWFIDRVGAGSPQYNMPCGWRIQGDFHEAAAEAALRLIIERHDVLRTIFVDSETGPLQRVRDRFEFVLAREDLQNVPVPVQQSMVRAALEKDARRAFDLSKDLMLRAAFMRLSAQEGVLLLNMHHIASDGWSMAVLMQEFAFCYEALLQAREPELAPLILRYADYAQWQRRWLQGEVLERQLRYWQDQLAGLPQVHSLPLDHPRPAAQSFTGAVHTLQIQPGVMEQLRDLAKSSRSTLFMVLHAAFAVLLSRHSRSEDIVIGTPVANRLQKELEPLVGFFVNMLVLRVRCEPEQSFLEHLQQVRRVNMEAQEHQDIPFEFLVERLQPLRTAAHGPLFQIVFGMNTAAQEIPLSRLRVTALKSERVAAKFDLEVAAKESQRGLQLSFIYNCDLFSAQTIEQWGSHFVRLLSGVAADPKRAIGELNLLGDDERRQLLYDFNSPRLEYSDLRCLHEVFEAQARRAPDAIAVVYESVRLSYRELNERANQLAHYLCAQGITTDALVGLCMERSLELVVGIIGILKAGAAYLPMDPAYPRERLAYMLTDAAPALLLTQKALLERLPHSGLKVLCLDESSDPLREQSRCNPSIPPSGLQTNRLAYVIYTSGSTGKPKGVMIDHANVARLFRATQDVFQFNDADVWTLFHSTAFDFSVWEIWGALLYGGRIVVVPTWCARAAEDFYALLCREGVTVLNQTPSAFRQLMHAQGQSMAAHKLRYVIFGGEALELSMLGAWIERNDPARTQLINMYGITEITVHATQRKITPTDVQLARGSPIGAALPDLQIYILDELRQPVPVRVVGELYVGGEGVARGYLNRPELTASRFLADPFSGKRGARMYKTGDLGRRLTDGTIEYLGRNDFQVKVRGFRIELGEIEAKLLAYPGVREAVVIARDKQSEDKQLIAYVVAQDKIDLSVRDLREALQAQLAEYMVPSAYVVLDRLPLTTNGKLDRDALPAPDHDAVVLRAYEAPEGEAEQALAQVWQHLLGLPRVGRHDRFFELGGHSLLVIRMVELLRRRELRAEVAAIFSSPTLSDLAAQLVPTRPTEAGSSMPPNWIDPDCQRITPEMLPLVNLRQEHIDTIVARAAGGAANIQDIYPLSPLQHGMLLHHLLHEEHEGDPYLLRIVLAFDSEERRRKCLTALQSVVNRHDVLRSAVFWQELPEPVQVVHRHALLPEIQHELSDDVLEQLLSRTDPRQVRLDLQRVPLLSAHIATHPHRGEWLLVLLNHHIVEDNYSVRMVMKEVELMLHGQENELPRPVPFRNFMARANATLPAHHEAYFRRQLSDVSEPAAPFGVLEVNGTGAHVNKARILFSEELSQRIRHSSRDQSVSPAVLFHVACAQVLARCIGRDDVVFGTVLSGRLDGGDGADQAVGMFINTLPVRLRLSNLSVSAAVREGHERLRELLQHERASLALAQRCSGVAPPLPLFTVILNCRLGYPRRPVEENIEAARVLDGMRVLGSEERTSYPLYLSVDDLGEQFALKIQCVPGMDPTQLGEYLHAAMQELVRALAESPQSLVTSLRIGSLDHSRVCTMPARQTSQESVRELRVYEAPRGEIEVALASIWQELLQVGQVGRHDNFFELGGHSLLVLSAIERMRQHGLHVTVRSLFTMSTLATLAAELAVNTAGAVQTLPESLVCLHIGKASSPPILCVPGAGASVAGFVGLANALGENWSLYGLQPRGLDGVQLPHASVEAAADDYIREIQATFPTGGVHLMGHSFGGWIAFEIARRLRQRGRRVASLTLIDSQAPHRDGSERREYTDTEILVKYIAVVEQAAERSLDVDKMAYGLQDRARQLAILRDAMVRAKLVPTGSTLDTLHAPLRVFTAALRTRYEPSGHYPGPVRLAFVRAAGSGASPNQRQHDPALETWRSFAPSITSWTGPGNHMTILKPPHVDVFAAWWRDGLPSR